MQMAASLAGNPRAAATSPSQDPSALSELEPLVGSLIPESIPVEFFGPQAQDPIVESEAQVPGMGSASPSATSLMNIVVTSPVETLLPVPGGRGVVPTPPHLNFTALTNSRYLPDDNPDPLAQAAPPPPSNSSNAKPAYCPSNPVLSLYPSGTAFASVCRSYLYLNSARSIWGVCTAWFADPTHAVVSGECVAPGGTGTFSPVWVGGRWGTVCCRTQPNTGPDNCQAGYGFDILDFSTTRGWLKSGRATNNGAVLKLRRPNPTAPGVGVALRYGQAPCLSTVSYAGYPVVDSRFAGCNQAWGERLGVSTTSGNLICKFSGTDPSLAYRGSTCSGMAGAPMFNPSTSFVSGIQTQTDYACASGRSSTYFVALSNSIQDWGVNLPDLIAAVP
jgi:hypothetical protein